MDEREFERAVKIARKIAEQAASGITESLVAGKKDIARVYFEQQSVGAKSEPAKALVGPIVGAGQPA